MGRVRRSIMIGLGVAAAAVFTGFEAHGRPIIRFDAAFAASSGPCTSQGWTPITVPKASSADSFLAGTLDPSTGRIWAGGHTAASGAAGAKPPASTLVEDSTGGTFSQVPAPSPAFPNSNVTGLYFPGSGQGDLVGWSTDFANPQALYEHWSGTAWSLVPGPEPSSLNTALYGIAGSSSSDEWAVGEFDSPDGYETMPLAVHFDGNGWAPVATDPDVAQGELYGVTDKAPDDVWAVGSQTTPTAVMPLVEHWDGTSWSALPTPPISSDSGELFGVSATSDSDVWISGQYNAGQSLAPLVEHWNGSSWSTELTGLPNISNGRLTSITELAPGDVWAVGSEINTPIPAGSSLTHGATLGLIVHYDGSTWTKISTANTSATGSTFEQLTTGLAHTMWLLGQLNGRALAERICPVQIGDAGFSAAKTTVAAGNPAAWTADSQATTSVSLTDATGLGLFPAVTLPAGSSYTFAYHTAGTYTVASQPSGASQTLAVALQTNPVTGSTTTTYTLAWGTSVPSGYAEQVQILRPATTAYVNWIARSVASSAPFTPDAGAGTYKFRARLVKSNTTIYSGWSPPVTITPS